MSRRTRRTRRSRSNRFKARLFWMGKRNFVVGERYKLKLATQELDAEIVSIEKIIDASTLENVSGRPQLHRAE